MPPQPQQAAPEPPQETPGGDEGKSFHIESDMLPTDLAKSLKAGAVLQFRVVTPASEDGLIEVCYDRGGGSKTGSTQRDEAEGMMGDFANYMSARKDDGGEEDMA